jgi:uncharacterized protein YecT (DUF1311 family)
MNNKRLVLITITALSIITLSACAKGNEKNQISAGKTEQNQQLKDSVGKADSTGKTAPAASTNDTKETKNNQQTSTTNTAAKIEGRRKEFLGKLDNIQKELNALPVKKDSDKGVTSAMRSYYGIAYDMYDKALNEIYALLKKQLSPETMKNLQAEQLKWIKEKEAAANEAASEFKGGTFEFVAYNSSLYESTKKRCYELVNKYMTD